MPNRRARRSGLLVEVDDTLLGGDEHCERDYGLRDRGQPHGASGIAARGAGSVGIGHNVYVAGTAPIPADGSPPPEGAYEQARLCFEIIGGALERAGARFE